MIFTRREYIINDYVHREFFFCHVISRAPHGGDWSRPSIVKCFFLEIILFAFSKKKNQMILFRLGENKESNLDK